MQFAHQLGTFLITAFMVYPAAAQGPHSRFDRLDTDGDGTITREEFEARDFPGRLGGQRPRGPIGLADGNQDKSVTLEEWQAFVQALDSDQNGLVDDSEREAMRPAGLRGGPGRRPFDRGDSDPTVAEMTDLFTRFDRNGDGVVDTGDRRRRRGGPRGAKAHRMERHPGQRLTQAADAAGNGDGMVSRDEWQSFLQDADRNDDGALSMMEILAVTAAQRTETGHHLMLDKLEARFDHLDTDGDGVLSGDELARRSHHGLRR